jgi:nucleotide-binding universal stress UspA family protein
MDSQASPAFKRILVPLDGSDLAEQSLAYARAIGGPEAELVLVHAVPPLEPERDWLKGLVFATVDEVQQRAKADAREMMLRAAHRWLGERPKVDLEILDGEPTETILHVAAQKKVDLIVLASHGRGTTGRLVFGSVADRIAHLAPVPVLIVRPLDAPADLVAAAIERVVVPLDGSDLAKQASPVASALAQDLKIPVVLVQAIDVVERIAPYPGAYAPPADLIRLATAAAAESLADIAATLCSAGIRTNIEFRVGPAFDTVAGVAVPGDIVVMASHGRSGIRRWLVGSVAEKLVRSGPVPVMIVPVGERASEATKVSSAESVFSMSA